MGDTAVAVQRVGGQIESISWMTADGFGTAINAFCRAELHGAGNLEAGKERLHDRHLPSCLYGAFYHPAYSYLERRPIFSLFIHEPEVIPAGADYLRIIGFRKCSCVWS